MEKFYYAYICEGLINSFEEEVAKRNVKIIHTSSAISENNEPLVYYVLQAKEGIIDSKWELI